MTASHLPVLALLTRDGRMIRVDEEASALFGLSSSDASDWAERLHPADRPVAGAAFREVAASPGAGRRITVRARDSAGTWHNMNLTLTNQFDDPTVGAMVMRGTAITERRRAEIIAGLGERLLEHLPVGVVVVDDAGIVMYGNEGATAALGLAAAQALGRSVDGLPAGSALHEHAADILTAINTGTGWEADDDGEREDGTPVALSLTATAMTDPNTGYRGAVIAATDVSERRAMEQRVALQAFQDPLTGLPNRVLFLDRLASAIDRSDTGDSSDVAVVSLDLDAFKDINDAFGRPAGDQALLSVARLLEGCLRPGDTLSRVGGDEFSICSESACTPQEAWALGEGILAALSMPFGTEARQVVLSASLGIAMAGPTDDPESVLRDAEAAMYRAKQLGKGRVELIDESLQEQAREQLAVSKAFTLALERDELRVVYQPQVDLRTGRIVGVEALARWDRPGHGPVPPQEFIPVAEHSGAIVPLGRRVLEESVAFAARCRGAYAGGVIFSVNLSARQLEDSELVCTVADVLDRHDVPPGLLCLEITESVLMHDADESIKTLYRLKALGVRLAVDDFGTGYSSLSYLKRFPIDYLKVDRSFIDHLGTEPEDTAIVAAIIGLAHSLALDVIAEGVETPLQLQELWRLHCRFGQGFLWARPEGADQVEQLLAGGGLLRARLKE